MGGIYTEMAVISPAIPNKLITMKNKTIFTQLNIEIKNCDEFNSNLYSENWTGYYSRGTVELGVTDIVSTFQDIIRRSKGKLKYVAIEIGRTCNRTCTDGFGGGAIFVTADDFEDIYTTGWLDKKISLSDKNN